jgi:four helix bundle protein
MVTNDGTIRSYRDLLVWQKGMDFVDAIYDLSRDFPKTERFGLTSQITRAAVSVPANIAEGQGRPGSKDFAHFLTVARSSVHEAETLLTIAIRRRFITEAAAKDAFQLSLELSKMLAKLRERILTSSRAA